jgi:excisionase family DNA binding protein
MMLRAVGPSCVICQRWVGKSRIICAVALDLLKTDEVAEMLRVPVSTVRYWRTKNEGPRWARVGRRITYRRQDVEQWWERQQQLSSRG